MKLKTSMGEPENYLLEINLSPSFYRHEDNQFNKVIGWMQEKDIIDADQKVTSPGRLVLQWIPEKWNENVEKCEQCGIKWKKMGRQCPVCYSWSEHDREMYKEVKSMSDRDIRRGE